MNWTDCIEIKNQNAKVYSLKHFGKYRNEKLCRSRCGQGSPYNHRGKLKQLNAKETSAVKLANKSLIQKGIIQNAGEMEYRS